MTRGVGGGSQRRRRRCQQQREGQRALIKLCCSPGLLHKASEASTLALCGAPAPWAAISPQHGLSSCRQVLCLFLTATKQGRV